MIKITLLNLTLIVLLLRIFEHIRSSSEIKLKMDFTISNRVPDVFFPSQVLLSTSISTQLRHQHLGHPAFSIIHHTLQPFIFVNNYYVQHVCSAYQKGKIINCSFPFTLNKSITLFELIHTDVWGLASILSHYRYRYYVHFLDDYSKFSRFYVIKNHFDTVCISMPFKHKLKILFVAKLNFYNLMAPKNFFLIPFKIKYKIMTFFIESHVHAFHNKMDLQCVSIVI